MKALLKKLYKLWMKFAHVLGKINTTILLSLFYITFIGIGKIIAVLLRKDPLSSLPTGSGSYWKKRTDFKSDREAFLKPY